MKIGLCGMTLLWADARLRADHRVRAATDFRWLTGSGGHLAAASQRSHVFGASSSRRFFLGSESKTGVVEGGVLPYQPWAAAKVRQLTEHMEFDPTGHCHYEGIPHAMYFSFQIVETPQFIAVLHENMHAWRLIYMDGSHHATDYSAWMGDSRGHWEGNTLVVDVADNNDKSVFDMAGHFHSDALHVVERFTPIDRDTINYQATIDDSKVFTRPWKMGFPLKRAPKDYMFLESGCFEDERDQQHLVKDHSALPAGHYQQ